MRPLKTRHCWRKSHVSERLDLLRVLQDFGRSNVWRKRTCHMNGRFFKFSSAYATTSRRNILPVAPLLNRSVKRYRRAGIPAMAARLAPKVRVPATIGRRCTADMVGRRDERVRRYLVEKNTNQGGKASMVCGIDRMLPPSQAYCFPWCLFSTRLLSRVGSKGARD